MIIFFLLNEDFNLSVRCEFKAYENLDEMQKVVAIFYNVLITRIKEWVMENLHHPEILENWSLGLFDF